VEKVLALLAFVAVFVGVPLACMGVEAAGRWAWSRVRRRRAEVVEAPDWGEVRRWLDDAA
jgi:hypothetical protein